MPSNRLILCCPLLLLPSVFPSIRVFSSESGSSHQVAKILELQLQRQSFQWIFQCRLPLGLTALISLQSKVLSGVFSTIVGEVFTSLVPQFLHLENGSTSTYSFFFFLRRLMSVMSWAYPHYILTWKKIVWESRASKDIIMAGASWCLLCPRS